MAEIDLEALAAGYAHRPPSRATLLRAAAAADAAHLTDGSVAVDAGGGRGRHAGLFAARGATAIVVDRSMGMIAVSSGIAGVSAVAGDIRALPLANESCDLVYFHLSLQYGGWQTALEEASRVCRPGGMVWVWTFRREHHRLSFLAEWFPSIGSIDESRFPDPDQIAAHLEATNMTGIRSVDAPERVERSAKAWRDGVEAGFVSTLQMIPPEELAAGLERFDETHPDPEERISYELLYRSVSGVRPSLR